MALMSECIVTEPSSFDEAAQQPTWVDSMVEEYDSIIKKSAWKFFLRPVGKLMVGSRWIYKVKQTETYRRGNFDPSGEREYM